MSNVIPLFEVNPAIDRAAAAERFARDGRVQVKDFLTDAAAQTIHQVLSKETPWGIAWRAGEDGPHGLRAQELGGSPPPMRDISAKVGATMRGSEYAFIYGQYRLLDAYKEGWKEHPALELLVEHINAEPLLDMVREVTGIPELVKADAQATLYGPNHFLAMHNDSHVAQGWRVAYVMNFCLGDWRPDWGGYLLFHDEDGDIITGFKPRFNAINMFRVPQKHSVSFVPPFAPIGRFAITGWFRDH